MLALCLMLSVTHYAQNYAGIIGGSLVPTRLLRRYVSDCDYHIKSVTNQDEQIVHFNRLKPCKSGTCFHQNSPAEEDNQSDSPLSVDPMSIPRVVGDTLELVDCGMTNPHGITGAIRPAARF